jgi:DNA-binding response OmpR family regulator
MSSDVHSNAGGNAGRTMVYVVDDDESMREAVSTLLRSVGLGVETFGSAQEFLAYDMPDVPSCLILDVVSKVKADSRCRSRSRPVNSVCRSSS